MLIFILFTLYFCNFNILSQNMIHSIYSILLYSITNFLFYNFIILYSIILSYLLYNSNTPSQNIFHLHRFDIKNGGSRWRRSPAEKAEPRQPEEKSACTRTSSLLAAILITIIAFPMINDSFVNPSIGFWRQRSS